ncbi:MAG: uroporphyrinogen decarboxylase [Deltaproteobacteria bacterium]|nr:MAG: uroporphyrinogen decarboxylase [Deltaproteobacteria bacterium]
MNPEEIKNLFDRRLGRYQAAIALEPVDRMPIACGSNYFAEVYSGNDHQTTVYNQEKWLEAEKIFIRDFPEVDVLRDNRIYAPLFDVVNCRTYRMPGRDLEANTWFQFVEKENMKADEYDLLIENPTAFMLERYLPRVLGDFAEPGSHRAQVALLKGGMAFAQMGQVMRNRGLTLEKECGMPQPTAGFFLAPFDVIADAFRGLNGVVMDMFRKPDKLRAACDALVDEMVNMALVTADPLKRYPIFVPTHKPMFLSPSQFEEFYWPSFKKTILTLLDAGHNVRAYLEGDWSKHWHHIKELPKGRVVCDIDDQADILKALDDIGGHQCLAGGVLSSMLILEKPKAVKERVKLLCEAAGKDKHLLINGGCNIPHDTKAENYRAMLDAICEFGIYDPSLKPMPKTPPKPVNDVGPRMLTSWEERVDEWGGIRGEESLIRQPWELFEKLAYVWIWSWVS